MECPVTSEVSRDVLAGLLAHAIRTLPEECCGILLGERSGEREKVTATLPAANVHPSPETHFEIDPQALIDAHRAARTGGPLVLGYYHSHPNGRAEPSTTDNAMAAHDGLIWAIIAGDAITWWRDTPKGFETLPYADEAR